MDPIYAFVAQWYSGIVVVTLLSIAALLVLLAYGIRDSEAKDEPARWPSGWPSGDDDYVQRDTRPDDLAGSH